jgi:hypothetical protein
MIAQQVQRAPESQSVASALLPTRTTADDLIRDFFKALKEVNHPEFNTGEQGASPTVAQKTVLPPAKKKQETTDVA